MITWGVASPRVARDAPEKNVSEVLNEAFQSFKSSLDDLVKQIEVKTKKKISRIVKKMSGKVSLKREKLLFSLAD